MLLQSPYLEEGIMSGCRLNLFDLKCSLLGDDRRITPMQAVKNESLCLQQKKDLFQGTSGIAIPVRVPETNSESTSWFPQFLQVATHSDCRCENTARSLWQGKAGSTCRIDTFLDTDQKQPFSKHKEIQRMQNGKRSDKEWKMLEFIKRNRAANLITRSIHANLTLRRWSLCASRRVQTFLFVLCPYLHYVYYCWFVYVLLMFCLLLFAYHSLQYPPCLYAQLNLLRLVPQVPGLVWNLFDI